MERLGSIADVDVTAVWTALKDDQQAQLIDVRTVPEWSFVGIPDTSEIGRDPILIEWQSFPNGSPDAEFAAKLTAELERRGVPNSADLYFLCRSGGRSLAAAQTMSSTGFSKCHNVANGFEGPLDAHQHRGTTAGWKAAGLPWKQG